MNNAAKEWLIIAFQDLKTAKILYDSNEIITTNICYHCQQSVEKILKGFLVFNNLKIRKTHNIGELIEECKTIDKEFEYLFEIKVDDLTDYAIEVRYPDDFYIPSIEEAKDTIELAEKTKDFVLKKLKEKGFNL